MCVQCMIGAMSAGAGASGARSWLAARRFSWLTAPRLRRLTFALLTLALVASTLLVSGSTPRASTTHAASAVLSHAAHR